MAATHRPIAWVWSTNDVSATCLADRLFDVGVVDATHVVAAVDGIEPDAVAVVLVPSPGDDSHAMVRDVRLAVPHATVVVALLRPTAADVVRLFAEGANAVVDVGEDERGFAHSVGAALRFGSYVAPEFQAAVADAVIRRRLTEPKQRALMARLNPTEREILDLLVTGEDRAAIAARMNESVSRVRARIDRAKAKLGVSTQRDAVALVADYLNRAG